jgi:hypothetical protein
MNSKPILYSGVAQQLAQLNGRCLILAVEMKPPSQDPIFSFMPDMKFHAAEPSDSYQRERGIFWTLVASRMYQKDSD